MYSNHTDFNVTPLDPFFVIWTAMTRESRSGKVIGPDERVDAYTALQGITTGAAWQLFEENRKGMIKEGLLADVVILSGDPVKTGTREAPRVSRCWRRSSGERPFTSRANDASDGLCADRAIAQRRSRDQFFDHAGGLDAGQALVEPLIAEGESLMVETQQPEHGGVEVVDVHGVLDDVVGEIVGFAVDGPGPRAAAGHPHGEAAGMMIAAVVVVAQAALGIDGPAEFASPDDECFVEEPAAFKSRINPQQGWSTSRHWLGRRPPTLKWVSQLLW